MSKDKLGYFLVSANETDALLDIFQGTNPADKFHRPKAEPRRLSPQSTETILNRINEVLTDPSIPHDSKHIIAGVLRRARNSR